MKRFLFIMSDTGAGHRSSALAVRAEMLRQFGDSSCIDVADIFVESSLWPFSKFPAWYGTMVALRSIPYGLFFHGSDRLWVLRLVNALARPYIRRGLFRFLRRHPTDVIVSFHPVPNYSLVWAAQQLSWKPEVVAVAVDLVTVHAAYFPPGARAYFVPTTEARQRALHLGMPADRVEVTGGMPVRRTFVEASQIPKQEARQRLGLPTDRPIVLMVAGGEGMGPLDAIAAEVAKRQRDVQLIAIAGRNQGLYRRLAGLTLPAPVHVEGFTSNLELWMRAADILVTKAGPNTLSEACILGLPSVIYASLRGQEEGNAEYVVRHGAGLWAPGARKAAAAVVGLLADEPRRQAMAERAQTVLEPTAAAMLAGRLWDIAYAADQHAAEPVSRPAVSSPVRISESEPCTHLPIS